MIQRNAKILDQTRLKRYAKNRKTTFYVVDTKKYITLCYNGILNKKTDMKKCYIIMYDLRVPGRNYSQLYDAIKSYQIWGKITESTWAIVTEADHVSIRNYLMQFIDSNDRIMVIRSGQHAAWNNTLANNEWLQKNLIL